MERYEKAHTFYARRCGNQLQGKVQGRWYNIAYYQGKAYPPTSKLADMAKVIWLNTGKHLNLDDIKFIWEL
jgi:PHP family Zn ribbon phosphoesterase